MVLVRAWRETADVFGWSDLRKVILQALIPLVAIGLLWAVGNISGAFDKMNSFLFGVGVTLTAAFIWAIYRIIVVPPEIYSEQEGKITELSADNRRTLTTTTDVHWFQDMYDKGLSLHRRGPKPNPPAWRQEVISWCEAVYERLLQSAPQDEAWMFKTCTYWPDTSMAFDGCGVVFRGRLEKLRLIIGRLAKLPD